MLLFKCKIFLKNVMRYISITVIKNIFMKHNENLNIGIHYMMIKIAKIYNLNASHEESCWSLHDIVGVYVMYSGAIE